MPTVLSGQGHSLQWDIIPRSSGTIITPIALHDARILRFHGPLPEVLRCSTVVRLLAHASPLFEVQARADKDDHERGDDDVADDGAVVASEVEAEDSIDEADGNDGGAEIEVDFAEEGGGLAAFVVSVVDDANGELGDDAEEDNEANGLMGRVEVGVLVGVRLAMVSFEMWKRKSRKYVPCYF
jgi:hypothetical protein